MIYLCEYDGFLGQEILGVMQKELAKTFPEAWKTSRKWEKERQRILAWLLLAYGLGKEGFGQTERGSAPMPWRILQNLKIQRGPHGKPYSSAYPDLQFNLSHCDTACACIIGRKAVGIDVEKKFPYEVRLAKRFCHPDEYAVLAGLDDVAQERQLQILWSLKESILKLDGCGIGYGMQNINCAEALPVEDGLWQMGNFRVRVQTQDVCTLAACTETQNSYCSLRLQQHAARCTEIVPMIQFRACNPRDFHAFCMKTPRGIMEVCTETQNIPYEMQIKKIVEKDIMSYCIGG